MDDDAHDQSVFGVPNRTHYRRRRLLTIDDDAAPEAIERSRRWKPVEQRLVLLVNFEAWMHDTVSDFTVIRQQEQTLGLSVETPDRYDTSLDAHEVHDGVTSALIVRCSDVPLGLVQQQIPPTLIWNQIAIDLDFLLVRVDLGAKLSDDDPIDADAALDDHLFGTAARRNSSR